VNFRTEGEGFNPYLRDEATLARPWVNPGTPGLEHRIGGLEKADITGNVSYDPDNHEKMTHIRAENVDRIADDIPPTEIFGPQEGNLLLLSWGGTFGAVRTAVERKQGNGASVSHAHLRHLNPLPKDLRDILERFDQVLVPELNLGQLQKLIRAEYLIAAEGLNKVKGQPFHVFEVESKIDELLEGEA